MIPDLISVKNALWPLLPPGIYDATIEEVFQRFAINNKREDLFEGMIRGIDNIFRAGCPQVYIDGSYITGKPLPNDYEICWDVTNVDPYLLDPVFLEYGTDNHKKKYKGEYFADLWIEKISGKSFLKYFQQDTNSGSQKGIIRVTNYLK